MRGEAGSERPRRVLLHLAFRQGLACNAMRHVRAPSAEEDVSPVSKKLLGRRLWGLPLSLHAHARPWGATRTLSPFIVGGYPSRLAAELQ